MNLPEGTEPLEQADLDKAKQCFVEFLKPHLTSDNAKKVNDFVEKLFDDDKVKKVCNDKEAQKGVRIIFNVWLLNNCDRIICSRSNKVL